MHTWLSNKFITSPSIWGKLPVQGDFICYNTNQLQVASWQNWIKQQLANYEEEKISKTFILKLNLPIAFAIAPQQLPFSPKHFVVGIIAKSTDKSGKKYPIVIYQLASSYWIRKNFSQYDQSHHEWLFWLAQHVSCYLMNKDLSLTPNTRIKSLAESIEDLWKLFRPSWNMLFSAKKQVNQQFLEKYSEILLEHYLSRHLSGVSYFPYNNYPNILLQGNVSQMYWQQDINGGFVNVSEKISDLWSFSD